MEKNPVFVLKSSERPHVVAEQVHMLWHLLRRFFMVDLDGYTCYTPWNQDIDWSETTCFVRNRA